MLVTALTSLNKYMPYFYVDIDVLFWSLQMLYMYTYYIRQLKSFRKQNCICQSSQLRHVNASAPFIQTKDVLYCSSAHQRNKFCSAVL
jgi:hypothetical protein